MLKGTKIHGRSSWGSATAGRRRRRRRHAPHAKETRASGSRAARSSAPAARTVRGRRRRGADQENLERFGIDAIMAIGGEGTLAAAKRLTDAAEDRRRPQDRRQRPRRHGLHVRLRHRRPDRDRRHGPPPHHGRLAQPLHGGQGHGPPRRLDRAALRHGRGRARDPHPRAEDVDGRDRRLGAAPPTTAAARRSSSSRRASCPSTRPTRTASAGSTRSAVRGSAASASSSRPSSRSARASRPAPRPSATSSAAAPRRPTTACSRRASASPRSTAARRPLGHMVALRGPDIVHVAFEEALGQPQDRAAAALRRGRDPLRLIPSGRRRSPRSPPGRSVKP